MLACAFDESESFTDSPVLVVAGFCGGVEQWKFFSAEWLNVLSNYRLESPFKMQHFEKRKGQFRNFPEENRKPLLRDLLNVISIRAMMGMGAVVALEPYNRIITGDVKQHIGSAYALGVAGCFWVAGRWARSYAHNEPIAHFFDVGHKNAGDALECHKKHLASEEFKAGWRLGPITFDSDANFIPLQAADLFAYESQRNCTEEAIELAINKQPITAEMVRFPSKKLLQSMKLVVRFFDEQTLVQLRDNYVNRGVLDYEAGSKDSTLESK